RLRISSIALPPLGCGLGGLNWSEVKPMIEEAFESVPEVRALLFEPVGAPEARSMPVGTPRPGLTVARALLILLMKRYSESAYRLTLLEIQKLAYFLQESGQPLRLKYEAGYYGPYAANLNKVLETLEGHFTRGYGDCQKPDVEIELLPKADEEAESFLSENKESEDRLQQVADLIDGFETPYGMELISSVHWVARYGHPRALESTQARESLHHWNERKRKMFRAEHVKIAWVRLLEKGWL
ncbi:MAG: Appr-1-p processing protein, partial [bacterium]